MHKGMPYHPIQGQGQSQGHETLKTSKIKVSKF